MTLAAMHIVYRLEESSCQMPVPFLARCSPMLEHCCFQVLFSGRISHSALDQDMFYKQQIGMLLSSLDLEEAVTGCCDSPQLPFSSAHVDSHSPGYLQFSCPCSPSSLSTALGNGVL